MMATEMATTVLGTAKDRREELTAQVRFLREGSLSGLPKGAEYIVFLRWSPSVGRYVARSGDVWLVREGRISWRDDVDGTLSELSALEVLAKLQSLAVEP
jgi:hypothetical protein